MAKAFRAKFSKGRIERREPVGFREEAELIVTAEEVEARRDVVLGEAWAGDDPKAVGEALRETVGSWADIDSHAVIAVIHCAREDGTRAPSRS